MSHSLTYDLVHGAAAAVRPAYPRLAAFFESNLTFAVSTGQGLAYGAVGEMGELFPFTSRLVLTPAAGAGAELYDLYVGAMAEWADYPAVQAYFSFLSSL